MTTLLRLLQQSIGRSQSVATIAASLGLLFALSCTYSVAQSTVRFDATKTHQHITGFGGFVCSPQFQYNHMSTAEIKKVWGPESTVGCNIMRLYIPIGRNAWSQSLKTAKTAKEMGLLFSARFCPKKVICL